MNTMDTLDSSRMRLETLRGEPVAFRQQTVTSSNGVSVTWTGADMDYYEELCNMEARLVSESATCLESETTCSR